MPFDSAMPEIVTQRIRRLQAEARQLAREDVAGAIADMEALAARCGGIAAGGDAYPAGIRDLMARLVDQLGTVSQTATAINERTAP